VGSARQSGPQFCNVRVEARDALDAGQIAAVDRQIKRAVVSWYPDLTNYRPAPGDDVCAAEDPSGGTASALSLVPATAPQDFEEVALVRQGNARFDGGDIQGALALYNDQAGYQRARDQLQRLGSDVPDGAAP
jgi:hypothetical protein